MRRAMISVISLPCLLMALSCQTSRAPNPNSSNSNALDLVRRFSQALNDLDYSVYQESLSENAVWHYRGNTHDWTPDSELAIQSDWKRAFPDHQYRIDLMFACRDTVTVLYTYTGTHQDTILGIPPTGNSIAVPEMAIFRIENDLIVEQWVVFDEYLLRRQLGAD